MSDEAPDQGRIAYGCGRFYTRSSARCGDRSCGVFTEVGVVTRLERVSNSPDADLPGDFVAMVVEEIMFPDGWGLSKDDLKPRCPQHNGAKPDDDED